jgi:DNA-binding winged helix-turn-helix (wHTH) protein
MLTPQAVKLLDYLSEEGKEITQLVALTILGISSLTARIAELRRCGYDISKEQRSDIRGTKYTAYRLDATPHQKKQRKKDGRRAGTPTGPRSSRPQRPVPRVRKPKQRSRVR